MEKEILKDLSSYFSKEIKERGLEMIETLRKYIQDTFSVDVMISHNSDFIISGGTKEMRLEARKNLENIINVWCYGMGDKF